MLGSGDLARDLTRRQRAFGHVVLERDALHAGIGILPADHEHREPLLEKKPNETVLRLEIEDVELVDPGRHDEQRRGVSLLRHRRVLDHLDEAAALHHLPPPRGTAPPPSDSLARSDPDPPPPARTCTL